MATVTWTATEPPPPTCRGGAVTVGNFDGVHCGHRELVAAAVRWARRVGGPAVAVTFDPHPIALLAPDRLQPLLTTPADRAELLHRAGADHVLVLRTTPGAGNGDGTAAVAGPGQLDFLLAVDRLEASKLIGAAAQPDVNLLYVTLSATSTS
jgi:FAD synthase